MWEAEESAASGVECYYTGAQRLEENPYRVTSEPYMIVGLLAERQFGRFRLFINGENLTGVRQTRVGSARCGPRAAMTAAGRSTRGRRSTAA